MGEFKVGKNRTIGKDSRVRLRPNSLSVTCCAKNDKEIKYCSLQRIGLSHAERWDFLGEFCSSNPKGSIFFFLFLSFYP